MFTGAGFKAAITGGISVTAGFKGRFYHKSGVATGPGPPLLAIGIKTRPAWPDESR